MALDFSHVAAAQDFSVHADVWNYILDAARREARIVAREESQDTGNPLVKGNEILVENASGADVDQFGVLGIESWIFSPNDDISNFYGQRVPLKGIKPAYPAYFGKWVLTLEPIAAGGIGRAAYCGVFPARVYFGRSYDRYADIEHNDTSQLKGGPVGAAQILAKESGSGLLWAVVRIGRPGTSAIGIMDDDLERDGTASATLYTAENGGDEEATDWTITVSGFLVPSGKKIATGSRVPLERTNDVWYPTNADDCLQDA